MILVINSKSYQPYLIILNNLSLCQRLIKNIDPASEMYEEI